PPAASYATSAIGGITATQRSAKSLNKAFRDMVKTQIVLLKAAFYAAGGICDKASNRCIKGRPSGMSDPLIFEKEGPVVTLTINRPEIRNPLGAPEDAENFSAAAAR